MVKKPRRYSHRKRFIVDNDPDIPPVRGAYRHPDGSWILPRPKDAGQVYVGAVKFNKELDLYELFRLVVNHIREQEHLEQQKQNEDQGQAA